MAIIKFDSDKADALIRDLNKISTDIDSNLRKVYSNSYGKEINLSSSNLKVYAYRNKTFDITQDDGTVVQKTIREKYLKHDYVANARAYNQHIRNLYRRSNSAKTKASQSIESVINSLNKIKSLINEYESDTSLKMANSLDGVGQFDFNFLSAYGPMSGSHSFSPSLGAIVADEVYTSLYLGVLGERPTSLNLAKLKVFDDIFDIAINEGLSYQEKFDDVKNLLMENVLDIDPEMMDEKAKMALESMIGIIGSKDIEIDDNLRIESLIKLGVPIIDKLESSELAIDFETVPGLLGSAAELGAIVAGVSNEMPDLNIDTDGDGVPNLQMPNQGSGHANSGHVALESQLGIKSDVQLDKGVKGLGGVAKHVEEHVAPKAVQASEPVKEGSTANNTSGAKPVLVSNNTKNHVNNAPVIKEEPVKKAAPEVLQDMPKLASTKNEEAKVQIADEVKLTSDEIVLEKELQQNKISYEHVAPTTESKVVESIESAMDSGEILEKKGVGVVAGAAGIGALSNMASGGSNNIPQVNGMAAGDILGINNNIDNGSMGSFVDSSITAAPSTGTIQTNTPTSTTAKIESTSDRGSIGNTNSNKTTHTSSSGKGGSTLEDKDDNENKNTYGKPNKPEDVEENDQKGLLGDASIAELDAKDEKNIKIATGVTAGTVLVSSVLALMNILSWLMIILAIVALIAYCGYRIKKKKDKQKRRELLEASKQVEQVAPTITLENVQNVSDISLETNSDSSNSEEVVNDSFDSQTFVSTNNEFSEQPYEPSRDGVMDISAKGDSTK